MSLTGSRKFLGLFKHSVNASDVEATPPTPSISLLFSLLSRRQILLLLVPASFSSVVAGGIAPFMTYVIGRSFDAFATFSTSNSSQPAREKLLHDVGIAALLLLALAAGAMALGSINSSLWIWLGGYNAMAIRNRVYDAVTAKDLAWFDQNTVAEGEEGERELLGAGGLMAKFARETDDVRMASSLASGACLQYLTTSITCLILAFLRSFSLTLVILSTVPLLIILQGVSQSLASPLLASERSHTASAATLTSRAIACISTVKAFNATSRENKSLSVVLSRMQSVSTRLTIVWSVTSYVAQFVMMAMFVQGFWYGSKLVREHKVSAGDVMAVFWACLIATSNLQMTIPQLITLAKGKSSMASLITLMPISSATTLRKIVPKVCEGELGIQNVTFSYPSRPTVPVLQDVSIFLPAREMTFIVGSSGSGKSTIAHLLQHLYSPQSGSIHLDDQDISFLDATWLRQGVACVSQQCILFDMSLHDNVAMGREGASREQVIKACTVALINEFVRDLPEGYETMLGVGGANLSGGQRQRLAIARALLRDPTVLILDEATSALDPTSRLLVFEGIKSYRKNKTTVVITHDLSQVSSGDFVYVLKGGRVVEQGYRADLERIEGGELKGMVDTQIPTTDIRLKEGIRSTTDIFEKQEAGRGDLDEVGFSEHQVWMRPSMRPLTIGGWTFDNSARGSASPALADSCLLPSHLFGNEHFQTIRHASSIPSLAFASRKSFHRPAFDSSALDPDNFVMQRTGTEASQRRLLNVKARRGADELSRDEPIDVKTETPNDQLPSDCHRRGSLWQLLRNIYPTVPNKPLILLGLVVCILSGAMTPLFSLLLSRLLFEVSIGASNVSTINKYGAITLSVAAVDGLLLGLKYFIMETASISWITKLRRSCFRLILIQDKKWFDKSANSPVHLVQSLIKDGDDARGLISEVLGQFVVVVTMLGVGLIWAMIRGWQLTLAGAAIAPVFAVTMVAQTRLVSKCELRNKRAREEVTKEYYETVSNIRGIRAMALESVFQRQFAKSVGHALSTGVRGAFVEGCTYGVASALIYFAEAILFYVGAVLISRGIYSYLQMVEVLNLIIFSVTIGSQLMIFTDKIAKSLQAARDLDRLMNLSTNTDESHGTLLPPLSGPIHFNNISFSYPERSDVSILERFSLSVDKGECVAIVGPSGAGKSTVAALLQRFYEPSSGDISIGSNNLQAMDVTYLRDNVAIVSQSPYLFDGTIAENIAYGSNSLTDMDIRRAAEAANIHDFILSLPHGYDTMVGENASLISGGEAQRLQMARALARTSKILILDECTSALDPSNEAAVLDTIRQVKIGRTTVIITHKLPVMRMCNRIVLLNDGRVAEHGTYDDLMKQNGVFAQLARAGEWVGE